MLAYRIADGRFPVYSGEGAARFGARWNSVGHAVIYAASSYSGAVLEVLAHSQSGDVPKHQAMVEITIPASITAETLSPAKLPGWDSEDMAVARAFGDAWLEQQRSAVVLVPGMVTQGRESNVLINPAHPDFRLIRPSKPQLVKWDVRLFKK
jgi:RES domain-containing protein